MVMTKQTGLKTVSPWIVDTRPTKNPLLTQLILRHQDSERFVGYHHYADDELEEAIAVAERAVIRRKHMLTLDNFTIAAHLSTVDEKDYPQKYKKAIKRFGSIDSLLVVSRDSVKTMEDCAVKAGFSLDVLSNFLERQRKNYALPEKV